jgi:hypothetical protein
MTFAKLSITEIQQLHKAKVSGFEMLVYSVISSHIHNASRQNAWPSLRRIAAVLGGNTTIQSISRAIKGLSDKEVIVKGKVRSKSRFTLIWRPVRQVTKKCRQAVQASKHFVRRFTPSSLSNAFSQDFTKPFRQQETYQKLEYKTGNEVKKNQVVYEEMGMALWERVAPTGFNETVNIDKLNPEEKKVLRKWISLGNTENKKWIQSEYGAMI